MVDGRCGTCGAGQENLYLDEDEVSTCASCGGVLEQIWWRRPRGPAQWDDRTSVMVHVNPATGDVRYPGRHDAKLKDGYERQYLRSLPDVNRFEREHKVVNHTMHYDSNGRALDDTHNGQRMTH